MTHSWTTMQKALFDLTAGFTVIGFLNGFWDGLKNLHINWTFVFEAVMIQVVVILLRLILVGWWKKIGKRWFHLSALLLMAGLFVSCSTPRFTGTIGVPIQPKPVSADSIAADVVIENPQTADTAGTGKGSGVIGSTDPSPKLPGSGSPETKPNRPFKLTAHADTLINGVHITIYFYYMNGTGWFKFSDVRPSEVVPIPVELDQNGSSYRVKTPDPDDPSWYDSHPVEVVVWSLLTGAVVGFSLGVWLSRKR